MIKISNNSVNVKDNYKSLKIDFIFDSIFEGFTPAQVFVNNLEGHTISIVQEGVAFYFGGESCCESDYAETINYFKNTILPNREKPKYPVAKIFYSSKKWKSYLLNALEEYEVNIYDRILYKHDLNDIPQHNLEDDSHQILQINKGLLSKEFVNKKGLVNELVYMWGSVDNAIKNGFGSYSAKGDIITGWCTAEYVSAKNCGIGVETVEEFQRQGLAVSNTNNLLTMCKHKNITPHWDCWKTNIGSVKTAEKCNFKKVLEYDIIFLRN